VLHHLPTRAVSCPQKEHGGKKPPCLRLKMLGFPQLYLSESARGRKRFTGDIARF
jgi:hypothetical protein